MLTSRRPSDIELDIHRKGTEQPSHRQDINMLQDRRTTSSIWNHDGEFIEASISTTMFAIPHVDSSDMKSNQRLPRRAGNETPSIAG
jgi:hypothetical protein